MGDVGHRFRQFCDLGFRFRRFLCLSPKCQNSVRLPAELGVSLHTYGIVPADHYFVFILAALNCII